MLLEILEFVIGVIGLILLFRWLDEFRTDPLDYPQDYMG
jgi:hypothetical protein